MHPNRYERVVVVDQVASYIYQGMLAVCLVSINSGTRRKTREVDEPFDKFPQTAAQNKFSPSIKTTKPILLLVNVLTDFRSGSVQGVLEILEEMNLSHQKGGQPRTREVENCASQTSINGSNLMEI